jgi:hypothetical protein
MVLFPFSRSFYFFYVLIIATGLITIGLPKLWREFAGLRYAFLSVAIPIVITMAVWILFLGGHHYSEWFGKLGAILLAGLLGLTTAGLAKNNKAKPVAQIIMSIAIITWLLDACGQIIGGHPLDCRGSGSACTSAEHGLTLYFSGKTILGYYIGMMALLPTTWLWQKKQPFLAFLCLLIAGIVVMASGSRFGMLAYLMGCLFLMFMLTLPLKPLPRFSLWVGTPIALVAALMFFYHVNASFHSRMDATTLVLHALDYKTVNNALSGRLDIWLPAVALAKDHWLFGIGPTELPDAIRQYLGPTNFFRIVNMKIFHAHQVVLELLVTTGVIGLFSFFTFYFWLLVKTIKSAKTRITMGTCSLLIFLLMWFPLNSPNGFYSSQLLFISFYILGLGFGWTPSNKSSEQEVIEG